MYRTGIIGVGLAVALLGASSATATGAAPERAATSVVGSWKVVDDNTGEVFLGTYDGGPDAGNVHFTSPNDTTTLSHGQWERTGPDTYRDTDVALLLGPDGRATSTITFRAEITVAPGGDTAEFDFEFEVAGLDGAPLSQGSSTGDGTRISVQPRTGS